MKWVKVKKQVCRSVNPTVASFFEDLAHPRNVASLSLLSRYMEDFDLNQLN